VSSERLPGSSSALDLSETVSDVGSHQESVSAAGLKLNSMIYGGKPDESLNHLRYVAYMNQLATSFLRPRPERLPPSGRAAHFHVCRVHLQVVQWKTLMRDFLDPQDWGWKLVDGQLIPIATDLEAALEDILNVVRRKCKADSSNPRGTRLCSCRKHGLSCVPACKNCYGELCHNVKQSPVDDDGENVLLEDDLITDDSLEFDSPWYEEMIVKG